MPHIIVEYSANLEPDLDLAALLAGLHDSALATGVFPVGGLRTRAARRDAFVIADRDPANGFVHIVLRIGHGRDLATKQAAASRIFDAVKAQLAPLFERTPLAISLEVQEIDADLSFKHNNLHQYVERRRAEEGA